MDSPPALPPQKRRKVTVASPEVSQQMLAAIEDRLARWLRRDMWRIREGCDLAWHILPVRVLRQFYLSRIVESENLCEWAERAVEAEVLPAKKVKGPPSEWWVRPVDFCRWVSVQDQLIGKGRAAIFQRAIPCDAATVTARQRARVLDSGFSTPEFDAAIEAIAKFWLPLKEGDEPINYKIVIDWLMTERHLSKNAAQRVDTLIRPPDAKTGGRKRTPQKAQ